MGYDLNSIPPSMIERIEVLRDGAAAQYGTDAIAGVINIVLKQDVETINFTTQTGITAEGDGGQIKASANYGWRLPRDGFVNGSIEFLARDRTNRAGDYTGQIFPGVEDAAMTDSILADRGLEREDFSMKIGQSRAIIGMLWLNGEVPINDDWTLYSHGGITSKQGFASGFYRLPFQEARVDLRVYPDGFLPEINPNLLDWSIVGGVRGKIAGLDANLSVTQGGNSFHFFVENSINASLGLASPTDFDAGRLVFHQTSGNLDLVKPIELAAVKSLAAVFGGEIRGENYEIHAGEPASYVAGPETTSTGAPKTPGAQVFPGFQPESEVDEWRQNYSAYAGIESQLTDRILLDVGGRFENYSDFGNTVIGKAATRVEVVKNVSLRAAASTGFRAPSLHQLWFSTVSTQFVDEGGALVPKQVLTSNNASEVTRAFGIPDLDEETSINVSAGITAKPLKNLSLTADFYRIQIADRIVLTNRFAATAGCDPGDMTLGCQVATILEPFPAVSQAQFFSNAVDTTTNGVDIVVDYGMKVGTGQLKLTASANLTDTSVDAINLPDGVVQAFGANREEVEGVFFNREERNRLEDALPRQKGALGARYKMGKISARLLASYYGSVEYKPNNPDNDETFDAKVILDTDVAYQLGHWKVSVGANNLLNTFPDKHEIDANISSGRFVYSRRVSQFGVNGGFYYLRLQYLR